MNTQQIKPPEEHSRNDPYQILQKKMILGQFRMEKWPFLNTFANGRISNYGMKFFYQTLTKT